MKLKIISLISVELTVVILACGILVNENIASKQSAKLSSAPTIEQPSSNTESKTDADTRNNTETTAPQSSNVTNNQKVVSSTELSQANGLSGNPCFVAVDGTVYSISGFALWADGLHSPSGGRARCGKDLTSVIGQSPHGKTKLKLLKEVGILQ